jgi:hypothetical protein
MSAVDVKNENKANMSKISHEDISGIDLSVAPAIQFHQKLRADTGQERYTNQLNFQSPALDQDNRIYFPSMPVIPEELTLQFKMATATASGSDPVAYCKVWSWIGANGLRLLYKNTTVYNCSQAELEACAVMDNTPSDYWRQQFISNDLASPPDDGDSALKNYYLRLDPLMKIFRHIGCLSAYDANAWSIEIDLKPASGIVRLASGTTDTGAGSGSITTMSLLISGHRASPELAQSVRNKLNSGGLQVNYLQSNYQRDSLGSSDTTITVTLNQLEGNVAGMFIICRKQAYVNGATVDALETVNEYLSADEYDDTIRVGVSENPTLVFGRDLPQLAVRMGINSSKQYLGSPIGVDVDGSQYNYNIIPVSFADAHSTDSISGTSSGYYYVKNNLQFQLDYGTSPGSVAGYIESIVYIHRYAVFRADGVAQNNLA